MTRSRPLRAFAFLALVLAFRAAPLLAVEANARNTALESITTEEVAGHVNVLADDTFEGREAGTRGSRAAAVYIVERLKKFGLHGGGPGGSFYQTGNGSNNILALVDGSDPTLKGEVILLGAHYDHVGYGTYRNSYGPIGRIHNGADDNASGVSALLEVADAVSRLPQKPKRSILFAFWDGEEKGLLGSKYWIEHPTVPLEQLKLAINIDMIGRLRKSRVQVFGTRTATGLRRLVSRQNDPALLLEFKWNVRPDSDHYTFYSRDIPFLMLHTGLHDDYHRPSDDAEKINREGLKEIAQVLFGIVTELADAPDLGGFRRRSKSESRGTEGIRRVVLRPPPGRLGVSWDQAAARDGKIVVVSVVPDSAAEAAGLQPGDQLLTFAGRAVDDEQQFRIGVLAAENPVTATIDRPGEEEPLELALELIGEPVRLGISWRTDPAEPNAVIVNRLTSGSPADLAELREGDRIYQINGLDFDGSDAFRELATTLPLPLVLEVERSGRVRIVEVPHLRDAGERLNADADEDASPADDS